MKQFLTLMLSILSLTAFASHKMANVVCFVKFADQAKEEWAHDFDYYGSMFNNTGDDANSVRKYFHDMSYGNMDWESTIVTTVYTDSHIRNYFRRSSSTNPDGYNSLEMMLGTREQTLIKDMCAFLDEKLPDDIFLDGDDDGNIDNLVIIIAGECEIGSSHLLWPANNICRTTSAYLKGKKVRNYLKVFDKANGWDKSFKGIPLNTGVLCHEMMHTLNAYDLYSNGSPKLNPVGVWDLMSDNNIVPQSFSAYTRATYGKDYGDWLPESRIEQISQSGVYTLPSHNSMDAESVACKIVPEKSRGEYYMLEYRDKASVWDKALPNSGLLIYRVDPSVNGNLGGQDFEMYVFRPGGSTEKAGKIELAPLGKDTGRFSFGTDADEDYPFNVYGQKAGFSISEVSEADGKVSFRVNLGESGIDGITGDSNILRFDAATGTVIAPDAINVVVYDLAGKTVSDLSVSAPGIYVVKATFADGSAKTLKIRK